VYRAHLLVYGTDTKPLTINAIERQFRPSAVGGHTGTRHGRPGIWVERQSAQGFREAVDGIVKFALVTGFGFDIGCTNAPSREQAQTVLDWTASRGVAGLGNLVRVTRA
jgi:hypothetical protein